MASRSCANLLGLVSGDLLDVPHTPRKIPKVMTVPGIICDYDGEEYISVRRERKIIVANMLPLQASRDTETSRWKFSLDEDSILLQLKNGLAPDTEVVYVGSLKADVDLSEQDAVAQTLLEDFNCVPTFLPSDLQKKYYHGFCKQYLWPLFHYMLPMCPEHGERFDRSLWQAYVSANKKFADKVMEVINLEEDSVWIHDYHLMVLPTFLRKRYYRVKMGFFLHSPFPSSEIYRSLPVRDEMLRSLLNCDLVGFHTFDYARHFLSCCSRMLGLDYASKRGHIGLDYFGRTVYIKILPVGIHVGRLESVLNLPCTSAKVKEIKDRFRDKKLIVGIDDMDLFKGISLKMLALEHLLQQKPEFQGKLVLMQIINPARSSGKDVQEANRETYLIAGRINEEYGHDDYQPVVLIDRPVARYEKSAYYAVADCCLVNAVRDGMNLVPYKYVVCRQGTPYLDDALGVERNSPHTSALVVSEFVGCSPSLSGAIRVNPWDVDAVAEALNMALTMPTMEKQLRHDKHYRYVSSHDVAYWARSFFQDLERSCKEHYNKRCWGFGLGLGFRVVSLSPSFRKLSVEPIVAAYRRMNRRVIFLDYDGTVVPQSAINKWPTSEVISVLNTLCADPKNTVFIVSGRGKSSLSDWLSPCQNLGIAAEHGYFIRWSNASDWESSTAPCDLDWKEVVEPLMKSYMEATDGSNIEVKESALVWHYQDADPDFGSWQATELMLHLENVLANEPVVVKRGHQIVEVKPQGVRKGLVVEKVLSEMLNTGKSPDFLMCIGDDRSDEDMYESLLKAVVSGESPPVNPEIFACTVGQKPSKAKYYLDDTSDVLRLLEGLATASNPKPRKHLQVKVSFESYA